MRQKIVSVIGGRVCSSKVERQAHELGFRLAKVVPYLASGGLSGTMRAVCQGFKEGGGTTIGIIPGYNKREVNPFVDLVIPTGLGLARNVLVVTTGDAVVALPGGPGTLSEIAYCLQFGIPVISFKSWKVKGALPASTVDEAVAKVQAVLNKKETHIPRDLWTRYRR